MTVEIRTCVDIGAPPARVWADVERVESHVEWMRDAVRIEPRTAARRGVGATFSCLTRVGPLTNRDVLVVTEWTPERLLTIEHTGAVRGVGRFELAPADGGTRFCWDETLRFPWWMAGPIGERLARPVLRRLWRSNLARLRGRFERD